MKQMSFHRRFITPVAATVIVLLFSTLLYNNAWQFLDASIHRPLAVVSAVLMAVSIAYSSLMIYPVTYFRGATLKERVIACLVPPIIWNIKELLLFPDYFSVSETLYYGFSPLFLGIISATVMQMGILEAICRFYLKRKGRFSGRVLSGRPVSAVVVGGFSLYFLSLWDEGVGFWYIYQGLYQYLFL